MRRGRVQLPTIGVMRDGDADFDIDNPQLDLAAESFDTDAVNLTEGDDPEAELDAPPGTDAY